MAALFVFEKPNVLKHINYVSLLMVWLVVINPESSIKLFQ